MRFKFVILCLFFMSTLAFSSRFRLLDIDEASVDAFKVEDYRNSYWEEDADKFTHGGNFNLNYSVLKYGFLENCLHFIGTSSQIRQAGWQWRAGVRLGDYMDVFWFHHSQHVMERERLNHDFPLENFYGVRFYFKKR